MGLQGMQAVALYPSYILFVSFDYRFELITKIKFYTIILNL